MKEKQDSPPPVHWLVRPRTIRWLWVGFALILLITLVAERLVHLHPSFGVDGSFAFNAWFGALSCVLMILVAKLLGLLLKRRDDFYDE